jgi:hypothetical protein
LRLVGVPAVRDRDRHDALPASAPSRDLRSLCCEGACSTRLAAHLAHEDALRAIGYTPYNLRAAESAAMTHTPHYFVRVFVLGSTVLHQWACTVCGNERVYGAEEA